MFNRFEQDKDILKLQYEKDNWADGMKIEDLFVGVDNVISKYINTSFGKAKAEAIAYILRNAEIEVNPLDIFADKINCSDIMPNLREERKEILKNSLGNIEVPFSQSGAFDALMDFGHISSDWDYLISNGIVGVIENLEKYRSLHLDDAEKLEFYDNSLTVYRAIIDLFFRIAVLAEQTGTKQSLFVAENMKALAISKPKTVAQAMQLTLIMYNIQTNLDSTIVRSLGGIDHIYYPFYKNDIESGLFTEVDERNIVKYFLWKISAIKAIANTPFYIGGKDANGNDMTNDFTYLLLEEYRKLDIYDPKIHVMCNDRLPQKLIDMVFETIREGKNSFVFMNTDVAIKSLEKIGISSEDAKRLTVYGCYEPAAEGTEIPSTCGGLVNMAKAVELAVYNGVDVITNEAIGLKTGEEFNNFEEFLIAVKLQLKHITVACMDIISKFEPHYKDVCTSPIMSATYKSSLESGKDLYSGGAKYNNTSIVGMGIATLTDSCMAVKKLVFEEKIISFKNLKQVLLNDWKNNENLLLLAKNKCLKYGNNNKEADSIAVELFDVFANEINNRPNGRNGVFRCGLFSVDWRFGFGEKTSATPDGRRCGETLSKNVCAVTGQDKNGVTALIQSILKFNSEKIPDGCVTDIVLHHSAVSGEDGLVALNGLLKAFLSGGGSSIHFNVLNPTVLRDAQKHPEKYQNLQVRLCGWNVRFIDLSNIEQNEFILQAENG